MKKIHPAKITLFLLLSIAIYSCQGKKSTPREVAIAFANSLDQGKIETLKLYTTELTALEFEDKFRSKKFDNFRLDVNYEFVKEEINGKRGIVYITDKSIKKPRKTPIEVVLIDNNWKVTYENARRRKAKNPKWTIPFGSLK